MKLPVVSTQAAKGFDLRIWFVLVSILSIVVINTLTALVLSHYVSESFIHRQGEVAREFLDSIISAEKSGDHLFDTPSPSPELRSFSNHVSKLPGLIRAVIYSPDFVIRYSTEAKLIGMEFSDNDDLREAFEGQLIANVEEIEESTKSERVTFSLPPGEKLIEAYIPVRDDGGKVIAVVEFYSRPDAVQAIISNVTLVIWLSAIAAGLLLFASLYGAVSRGTKVIQRQQREIADMAALAALGQMASAVAHSLRNPLAGIRSSTELLKMMRGDAVEPAATDILGEVDRMNQHVHELLDYARSDGGSPQRIDLRVFVGELLQKSEPRFHRQGIAISYEADEKPDLTVSVDPPMFGQALASILSNALEAMPDGGTLGFRLSGDPSTGMARIAISDSGQGIPTEILEKLPSPFVTTKTRGLGLGLTLADRIVRRFGGEMSLSSPSGGGARVDILLPLSGDLL